MNKVKTTVKSILFLFLALFICTVNAASVSAETAKAESTQESSGIQSQTNTGEPKLYLDEDYDGSVCGNKLKVSGYVSNFRKVGIEKVYFNDTEVSLKEDGSFKKTINVGFNTKKYRICVKAENGDIISSKTIKVHRHPAMLIFSVYMFITGSFFAYVGIHTFEYYSNKGLLVAVIGAIIMILAIITFILFCVGIL